MAVLPTFEDLFEAAKQEALARPTRLTPEIFDLDGSDVNIAIAAGAAMTERVSSYSQQGLNSLRLSTVGSVSDAAVEELAASEFNEFRTGAQSAIVPLVFTRDSSNAATSIPADTLVGTSGGVTFRTATDLLFQGGETGPIETVGIATTPGTGGNVAAGSITRILSALDDTTIIVTNDEAAAGGREAETNEELIAKCQTAYQRARKGTLEAIEAEAAVVPGVVSSRAYELLNGDAQTGRVVVQILGAGRVSNRALADRVRTHLRNVRAAGVPVIVTAMTPRSVSIRVYGLSVLAGYDTDRVLDTARRALVAYLDVLQVGAVLYRSKLIAVLSGVDGLVVPDGALATPTSDVTPAAGEYLITTSSRVLVTTDAAP